MLEDFIREVKPKQRGPRSVLVNHLEEIKILRMKGYSYQQISDYLWQYKGIKKTRQGIKYIVDKHIKWD